MCSEIHIQDALLETIISKFLDENVVKRLSTRHLLKFA